MTNSIPNAPQISRKPTGKPAANPPRRANLAASGGAGAANPATAAQTVRHLTVDEESSGQRLDNFLIRHLKGVPKTHIYRIIRSGEVRVDKGRAQADTRVLPGQVLRVPPIRLSDAAQARADGTAPLAPAREFAVLFEDERILAINKPEGVAVHGGSGVSFGVIEQLRQARPQAKFLELVHRLDRDTSGVLLIAKKRTALTQLQDQFRARTLQKTYLAVVLGAWPANKRVIDKPLHKFLTEDGERRVRVVGHAEASSTDIEGKRSITLVKVAKTWTLPAPGPGAGQVLSLLEVTIKTGRTHQIRVHLSGEGHPIVGDDKYGDFDANKTLGKVGFKRMHLHAWRLVLPAVATELPDDLTLIAADPFGL